MTRTRLTLAAALLTGGAARHAGAQPAAAPLAGAQPSARSTPIAPLAGAVAPARAGVAARPNPLLGASPLPYQAPPFDQLRNEDYQPALEEGMRQQRAEFDAIANQTAAPTFDNTIAALERSGALLTRASKVFFHLVAANTNDTLQRVQTEEAPRLAAHSDALYLDARLFARVRTLYDRRASLGLTPEQTFLVERYHRDFVRAGARLSEADKARVRALNGEEAKLTAAFQTKLLAATKAGAVVVDDVRQLDGLSEGEIAAAAAAAKDRGMPGYVLVLQNTTQQPAQASLRNRALRERLFVASTTRAERGDSTDTRAVVARLAELRAERAQLLGYPTYAAYALEDRVAKTPENAAALLARIAPAATAKARGELAAMQALAARDGVAELRPWDWQYYAEQVRRAQYALDEGRIRPYFALDDVLQNGVFYAANRLYGITFKERKDLPVWHPDVRVFEVFDKDGSPLALWYCDYFKRDNKNGGAWEDQLVDQSGLVGTRPVVYNVANFQRPAAGQPALLSFYEATTMFHEFGHALHGFFSDLAYPSLGASARDFVEFPSQFNEHWATEPSVFAHYARHYRTGAPMPDSLVARLKAVRTFNQGFATTESVSAMLLDLAWHTRPAGAPALAPQDVGAFERDALKRYGVDVPQVPPRYRTPYFAHIWGGGYAAGYYAYLWSEVLDDDAYAWFEQHGGMTRENGERFRAMVLSRGGTADAGALYRAFAGRDPSVEPLMVQRGLVTAP